MDTFRCSRCLWLCRTRYRLKDSSVYPSPSVGCYRSSGLKIAICRREHLVCCSNSCSLHPLGKRKLLAELCVSSPTCCTGSKILGQPLTTCLGVFWGVVEGGGVWLFFLKTFAATHVIALPETAFSEYSAILCHCTDSSRNTFIFKLFYLFLTKIKAAIGNSFIFNAS